MDADVAIAGVVDHAALPIDDRSAIERNPERGDRRTAVRVDFDPSPPLRKTSIQIAIQDCIAGITTSCTIRPPSGVAQSPASSAIT